MAGDIRYVTDRVSFGLYCNCTGRVTVALVMGLVCKKCVLCCNVCVTVDCSCSAVLCCNVCVTVDCSCSAVL